MLPTPSHEAITSFSHERSSQCFGSRYVSLKHACLFFCNRTIKSAINGPSSSISFLGSARKSIGSRCSNRSRKVLPYISHGRFSLMLSCICSESYCGRSSRYKRHTGRASSKRRARLSQNLRIRSLCCFFVSSFSSFPVDPDFADEELLLRLRW